jgi:hypothetical protein
VTKNTLPGDLYFCRSSADIPVYQNPRVPCAPSDHRRCLHPELRIHRLLAVSTNISSWQDRGAIFLSGRSVNFSFRQWSLSNFNFSFRWYSLSIFNFSFHWCFVSTFSLSFRCHKSGHWGRSCCGAGVSDIGGRFCLLRQSKTQTQKNTRSSSRVYQKCRT